MTARVERSFRQFPEPLTDWIDRLTYRLHTGRILQKPDAVLEPLEDAMQAALPLVEPSDSFREGLRKNLSFAAQRKMAGLVIEYPKPFREGILIGVSVGIMVAAIATLVMVLRSHLTSSES
ncbi:MAG: hypothetical protein A2Y73_08375 [Chloroflexi bacterium RBG_13_56_8]|nr:MAG: hypothetical protein A2Y73_08375 [Chloroflexi bacterium RBG_13_56_8]